MTVKQLREWLMRQDDTAEISVRLESEQVFMGSFEMKIDNRMKSQEYEKETT